MKIAIITTVIKSGQIESVKSSLKKEISENIIIKGLISDKGDSTLIVLMPINTMKELSSKLYYGIHKIKGVINTFTKIGTIENDDFSKLKLFDFLTFVYCKKTKLLNTKNLLGSLLKDMISKPFLVEINEDEFYLIYEINNDFNNFDFNNAIVIKNLNSLEIVYKADHDL